VKINPPDAFSEDVQEQIRIAYDQMVKEVDDDELDYIARRYETTMVKLRLDDDWKQALGDHCDLLLRLLNSKEEGQPLLPVEGQRAVAAALFYVCSPYDLVGDRIPSLGYVDDAYVMNLCMARLEKICPKLLRQARSELGL
jgi:uncharacterized membrane protein YkvA (DUF1232 family)